MKDVDELMETYDLLNSDYPNKQPEVLKRAALIMSFTAWETYVEDCFDETVHRYLLGVKGSPIHQYIEGKVKNDLRYFHTPNSMKTKKLFEELLQKDITQDWKWENFDPKRAQEKLDYYIKLRGDIVHRAVTNKQEPHPVKKDEVEKCIRFLRSLAKAMDRSLA